ncbi:MAG: iron-containing alcohol dehydrogenase [Eisenbergiella sp.]
MPHGLANALILPYAMEINYVGNLEKFENIAVCLGENVEGLSLRDAAARSVKAIVDLKTTLEFREAFRGWRYKRYVRYRRYYGLQTAGH